MNLAPEFAAHWLAGSGEHAADAGAERDDEQMIQEAELEALAERVNAARSIV